MKERDHLEELDVGGMVILKCIFKKWEGEALTRFIWLWLWWRTLIWGNEHLGSVKCREFLD
jgi:hypothetical protein